MASAVDMLKAQKMIASERQEQPYLCDFLGTILLIGNVCASMIASQRILELPILNEDTAVFPQSFMMGCRKQWTTLEAIIPSHR